MMWYEKESTPSDVVISSRVRLARNLKDYPFPDIMNDACAKEVIQRIEDALAGQGYKKTDMSGMNGIRAAALVETHVISSDFAAKKSPHALFTNDEQSISLMACEEDHIRLQCILPGATLESAYKTALAADDILAGKLNIAFDEKLGYLTHCPTNLGTAMRASLMMFLPALTMAGKIPALSKQLGKLGITIRGMYGEGSESAGCLFQISNRVTLGITEDDIIKRVNDIGGEISKEELKLRRRIFEAQTDKLTNKIMRSFGIMQYATMISSSEFLKIYSDVRLGISLGLIKSDMLKANTLDRLLFSVMPASIALAKAANSDDGGTELSRDTLRADIIKNAI